MTYHYISLAIGRLPKYREIDYIVLHAEDGTPLPPMTDDEAFWRYACKKVADYWLEGREMHCKLEGVVSCWS